MSSTATLRRPALDATRELSSRVAVVIPAHNEAEGIADCIASVRQQTRRPLRVVVVADNCTDATVQLARDAGAEVIETVGNEHKKAGALNQALDLLVPELSEHDGVLIMDADTTVAADFIAVALRALDEDPRAGGVSSVFIGREARTLIGEIQRMEYFRYGRDLRRNGDQAFVMSGTASVFRASALRTVKAARDGKILPAGDGYYDVDSLTEDNELTFALKTLDMSCPAPGVVSVTDVMEGLPSLYHQRHRWYLGALRNLRNYGLRLPAHLRWLYWRQQVGLVLSVLSLALILTSMALGFLLHTSWAGSPIWLIPPGILFAERVATVWRMGAKQRLIAAALVPELLYSMFLVVTFASAFADFARGRKGAWHAT